MPEPELQRERYIRVNGQGTKIPIPLNSNSQEVVKELSNRPDNAASYQEVDSYEYWETTWVFRPGRQDDFWQFISFGHWRYAEMGRRKMKHKAVRTYDKDGNLLSLQESDEVLSDWQWPNTYHVAPANNPGSTAITVAPGTSVGVTIKLPQPPSPNSQPENQVQIQDGEDAQPDKSPDDRRNDKVTNIPQAELVTPQQDVIGSDVSQFDEVTMRYFGGFQDFLDPEVNDKKYLSKGISSISKQRIQFDVGTTLTREELAQLTPYSGYSLSKGWKTAKITSIEFAGKTYGTTEGVEDDLSYTTTYGTWIIKIRPFE